MIVDTTTHDALNELLATHGVDAMEAPAEGPMPHGAQAWFATVNGVPTIIYAAGQTDAFRLAITERALGAGRLAPGQRERPSPT
ncbi:hypothetical protein ACFZAM_33450 [Streptomyces sp. NPDC008079]|uniref:hypothetical protein n=1 Tax=Streptomyces sp. NPDC008079 TaxID=3364806 RepID=UPI0036E18A2D